MAENKFFDLILFFSAGFREAMKAGPVSGCFFCKVSPGEVYKYSKVDALSINFRAVGFVHILGGGGPPLISLV